MRHWTSRSCASIALLALAGAQAWSQVSAGTNLFAGGRTRLSLTGAYGRANDQNYGVVGLGAGYFLMDGLEAGVDGEAWFGAKPRIYKVSPSLTYVLRDVAEFKPYLGGFYRHTFYEDLADLDSAGGRAGVAMPLGPHAYLTAGLVYESYFHCDKAVYVRCSETYPEFGISFSY
jgi:hypothetical protein